MPREPRRITALPLLSGTIDFRSLSLVEMTIDKSEEAFPANGTSPHLAPLHSFSNITLQSPERTPTVGTLCIYDAHLDWRRDDTRAAEWSTPFTALNLHALSTEAENGPPCVYAQVSDECEEVRFLGELEVLKEIYKSLCDGVERNGEVDEEEAGVTLGGDGAGGAGDEEMMTRLDGMLTVDEGVVANGEEEEESR